MTDMADQQRPCDFDENNVRFVVDGLKEFAERRNLGFPTKVICKDEFMNFGLGCMWGDEIGHAIDIPSRSDYREAGRRLMAWKNQTSL
jgi:hypothetical protein